MKKIIKIYIVTYNNEKDINRNLETLFNSIREVSAEYKILVNIINNHSNFKIKKEYEDKVKILHNVLRPDFSTGHLSRNWNQAIINGFVDLKKPQCDILIHTQDDILWANDWLTKLLKVHDKYTFFAGQAGDAFCSYTPEAVRNIGLWDERFCNIGFQEFDYFTRAYVHNREKSCINAATNKHNPLHDVQRYFPYRPDRNKEREEAHVTSAKYHHFGWELLKSKWFKDASGVTPKNYWKMYKSKGSSRSNIKNFVLYPYFEKHIIDLDKKNYFTTFKQETKQSYKLAGVNK